jgi:hypothetical protein
MSLKRPYVIALASATAVCLLTVRQAILSDDDAVWRLAFAGMVPLVVAGGALVYLGTTAAYQRIRRRPARPSLRRVAMALTVGLVAAAPIPVDWNDGCNSHHAVIALAAVPYVIATDPADPRVPYFDDRTLIGC